MSPINPKSLRQENLNIGSEAVFQAKYPECDWVIIVEGITDKQVFERLVHKKTKVLAGEADRGGKSSVLKALKTAKAAGCKKVIGIVDSDFENTAWLFDKSKQLLNEPSNLFRTDTHDLETMIVSVTQLMELEKILKRCFGTSFWEECFKNKECKCHKNMGNLIREIIAVLLPLGYALWLSEINNWHISFRDINIYECFDGQQINLDRFVDALCHEYPLNVKSTMRKELGKALIMHSEQHNWQITCGHHLSKVLSMWFGMNQCLAYRFEKMLRDSFTIREFHNTALYKKIVEWQQGQRGVVSFT